MLRRCKNFLKELIAKYVTISTYISIFISNFTNMLMKLQNVSHKTHNIFLKDFHN